MALIFIEQKSGFRTIYKPQTYTVESDDVDIARVICDVYVNGSFQFSIEKSEDLNTVRRFTFDMSPAMQTVYNNSVLPKNPISGSSIAFSGDVAMTFQFYEVTLNPTTELLETTWAENGAGSGSLNSVSIDIVNATFPHELTGNLTPYTQDGIIFGKQFLSRGPTTKRKAIKGDTFKLDFINGGQDDFVGRVEHFDSTGASLGVIDTATGSSTNYQRAFEIDTAAAPAAAVRARYSVITPAIFPLSQLIEFDFIAECEDTTRIYWKNSLGGLDYYPFTAKYVKEFKHKAATFQKALGTSFDVEDRGETVYVNNVDEIRTIYTQTESRAVVEWLQELYTHKTEVFEGITLEGDDEYLPVIVLDGTTKIVDNDLGVYQVELKYRLANRNKAHIG